MSGGKALQNFNEELRMDEAKAQEKMRRRMPFRRVLTDAARIAVGASITASEFERRRLSVVGNKSELKQEGIENTRGHMYANIEKDEMEDFKKKDPDFYESYQKALGSLSDFEENQKEKGKDDGYSL